MFRPLSGTKFINDANLVSYWKLDDNSNDNKGTRNLTNVNNVSFSSAKFNNGANFGTSNSNKYLIKDNDDFGISTSSSVTLSCWVKMNSEISSSTQIFVMHQTTLGSSASRGLALRYDYNGGNRKIGFSYWRSGVIGGDVWYNITLGTSDWYHLVGTYNGSQIKLYLNGKYIGSNNNSGTGNNLGSRFSIGVNSENSSSLTNFASAIIDDVSIFSRALSSAEVNELYQSCTLGEYIPTSNTKLLLHLNGNSTDSSGNGNNGTDTAITYGDAYGKFGQGALFNGTSSKITIPATMEYMNNNFTFSFYIKRNNASQDFPLYMRMGSPTSGRELYFYIQAAAGYKLIIDVPYIANIGYSSIAIPYDKWINIIITKSSSTWKIYLDGKLDNTMYNAATIEQATGVYPLIGANISNNWYFNGAIDEVIIENRAWTPQEVYKYYSMTKGRFGII